jgi:hypothetical protein
VDGFRADYGEPLSGAGERVLVACDMGQPASTSFAKNNQLRTGADKGNPTV